MPGITLRGFDCDLCGREFTLLAGDLMVPIPRACDDCLREVWALEEEARSDHIAACLASKKPAEGGGRETAGAQVAAIAQHIGWEVERWGTIEQALARRAWERGELA